jgi:hypothetical protein
MKILQRLERKLLCDKIECQWKAGFHGDRFSI